MIKYWYLTMLPGVITVIMIILIMTVFGAGRHHWSPKIESPVSSQGHTHQGGDNG